MAYYGLLWELGVIRAYSFQKNKYGNECARMQSNLNE